MAPPSRSILSRPVSLRTQSQNLSSNWSLWSQHMRSLTHRRHHHWSPWDRWDQHHHPHHLSLESLDEKGWGVKSRCKTFAYITVKSHSHSGFIFFQNTTNRQAIACQWGQGVACLLWFVHRNYIVPRHSCIQYCVILDLVITASPGKFKSEHMLLIKIMRISCDTALRWMPQNTADCKSTLVWGKIRIYLQFLDAQWAQALEILLNTLRPRRNGHRFADNTFKRIFLNGDVSIANKISLKFVPKVPINNIPALV